MKISILSKDISVLAQPDVGQIAALAEAGFRSIIGNRPDGEAAGQPAWAVLETAAKEHGMEAVHIPVVASAISDADIAAFRSALGTLPKPIAAFCQSGRRSALLWALANPSGLSADERIQIAANGGYDLEPFRQLLNEEASHAQP